MTCSWMRVALATPAPATSSQTPPPGRPPDPVAGTVIAALCTPLPLTTIVTPYTEIDSTHPWGSVVVVDEAVAVEDVVCVVVVVCVVDAVEVVVDVVVSVKQSSELADVTRIVAVPAPTARKAACTVPSAS